MMKVFTTMLEIPEGNNQVSDMMMRFSTNDEVESMVECSKRGWQIDIRASNGTVMFHRIVKWSELEQMRHMSNKMDINGWVVLFYRVCFRQLTGDDSKRYELTARLEGNSDDDCRMCLDINMVSGKSTGIQLRQKLGGLTLDKVLGSEVDEDYDLFAWTREMCQDRDFCMDEIDRLERDNKKLKTQLDEFIAQEQLSVDQLIEKEKHQLMVFTRLINDMKEQYIKLQNTGHSEDVDDLINVEKIMSINEEVRLGEVQLSDLKLEDDKTRIPKKRAKLRTNCNEEPTTTQVAVNIENITSKRNKHEETSWSTIESHEDPNGTKLEPTNNLDISSDNHQESEFEDTVQDSETTEEQDTDYSGEDTEYE